MLIIFLHPEYLNKMSIAFYYLPLNACFLQITAENMDKSAADNRSNQMNPNHGSYWSSRDNSSRPSDFGSNLYF